MKNCKRLALLLILLLLIATLSTLFVACDFAEGEPYYGTYYGGKVNGKFINPTTIDKKYFNIEDQHLTYSYSDGRITLSSNAQVIFAENFQIHYLEKYLMSSVGWKGSIWQRDGYFNSTLYYSENNKILDTLNFYSNGEYKFVHSEPNGGFECGNYYLRSGVLTICCKESMEVSVVPNSERYWYIDKNYSIYAGVSVKESSSLIGENSTSPNPDSGNNGNNGNNSNNGNNGNNGNGSSQEKTYTVTWKNYDGTILKTDYVVRGGKAVYNGKTPTRPSDDGYTYSFTGWSPSTEYSIYEDTTFTAQYDATLAIPNLPTNTQPILESANTSFEGDGTEESPYLIKTSAQLLGMGAYADKHFALANNIILPLNSQDRPNFTPLFSDEKPFNCTFDGRGYTIKNLYIYNTDTYYTGLFAAVGESGVVKNLKLADVRIFGANYVGGIAGLSIGSITDCEVSGNITYVSANTYQVNVGGIVGRGNLDKCNTAVEIKVYGFNSTCYVGGLTGYSTSKVISGSNSTGKIIVKTTNENSGGYSFIGGLMGDGSSTIANSYNTGNITVDCQSMTTYIGGLAGDSYSITGSYNKGDIKIYGKSTAVVGGLMGGNAGSSKKVSYCYNVGDIIVDNLSSANIGGLIGNIWGGDITYSYNNGDISVACQENAYIGGLLGYAFSSIMSSYNTGTITVKGGGTACVGGLMGYLYNGNDITSSYNTGDIITEGGSASVGGLVGSGSSSITSSYNTGAITVNGSGSSTYVGGLAGYGDITIKNSHWLYYEDGAPVNAVGYNLGMGVPTNIGATKHMSISEFYNLADTLNEGLTTPAFEHKTSSSLPTLIKKEN